MSCIFGHVLTATQCSLSEPRETYSQHGEDLIVAKLFPDCFTGTLVEIGAWEPFQFSNSRLLIERGWNATLVEFSPHPLRNLVREYSGNENVRIVAAAITAEPQHVERYRITDDSLSSNDPHHLIKWKDYGPGYYGEMYVPTISVQALVDQFFGDSGIAFLSVDTEGTSVEIALAFMRLDIGWRPRVICVEHDDEAAVREESIGDVHQNAVKAPRFRWLMENADKLGYRLEWLNGCNAILVRA